MSLPRCRNATSTDSMNLKCLETCCILRHSVRYAWQTSVSVNRYGQAGRFMCVQHKDAPNRGPVRALLPAYPFFSLTMFKNQRGTSNRLRCPPKGLQRDKKGRGFVLPSTRPGTFRRSERFYILAVSVRQDLFLFFPFLFSRVGRQELNQRGQFRAEVVCL